MGVTEGPDLDGALTFALSNKLLYACVSSGILDKHDCFDELDRQKRARLKVKKTLVGFTRRIREDDFRLRYQTVGCVLLRCGGCSDGRR